MAQGWPAADGVQYTERVPAPPVARPLLSHPQLGAPASGMGSPSAPIMPPIGDDPDWRHDPWPATNGASQLYGDDVSRPDGSLRRQAARDDDWRLARDSSDRDGSGRANSADFPSEFTDQRLVPVDGGYGMSRADWGGFSQSGPHSEALRYRGGFSATELGLPRLTNPALQGELPPEWEDLLAGEMLPRRADVGPGIPHRSSQARRNPPDSYDSYDSYAYSSVGQPYAPNGPPSMQEARRERHANDAPSYGRPSAARSGQDGAQPLPTLASAHYPAFTESRVPAKPASRVPHVAREQRARRWPGLLLLVVLLLALVGGGVVLVKPTICPGTVCVQANRFLHRNLTFLGPIPNANVLRATPNVLTVQAITGSKTNLSVQVSNSGTDPAPWHATSSVGWLSITPSSGTLVPGATVTLSVAATPANVSPGNYSAQVVVETADTSVRIPVTANIASGPKIGLSTTAISATGAQCGVPQSFKVNNTGDTPLSFTATASKPTAITLTNASGSIDPGGSAAVSFTINCSAFFDTYTITVASDGGNSTVKIHYG